MTDVVVSADALTSFATEILSAIGCDEDIADAIASHLVGSDLRGVHSHGTMRLTQYEKQASSGYLDPTGRPRVERTGRGAVVIQGNAGFGHPAMNLAMTEAVTLAKQHGSAVVAVTNCGHTGRLGHYAEMAATAGLASIIGGGGRREHWRQVAPYGGVEAKLPTNPWAFGFPGTGDGPIIADFATGMTSGGKTQEARKRGQPMGGVFLQTSEGVPTDDPNAYLRDGGAIRPFAGARGYGMGLIAELLATAMLGTETVECNWVIVLIDVTTYRSSNKISEMVSDIVDDMRSTRPAPGFDRVEVPGQREHSIMTERLKNGIPIHPAVWSELQDLHSRLTTPVEEDS